MCFYRAEEEGEDVVDSDFSIDENDEPVSDNEEEGKKKTRRLVTKAYKEPTAAPKQQKPKPKPPKPKVDSPKVKSEFLESSEKYERKSIRKSTAAKSAATAQRIKVRTQEQKKKVKKPKEEEWVPSQEELLEEAKITEQENLQSLEKYQKMENEKKSKRPIKKTFSGPTISYHSMRFPVIEKEPGINDKNESSNKYYERTFWSFLNDPNDVVYKKVMNIKPKIKYPGNVKCAVTNLPAKYIDPLTCLPYHNSFSFKLIREAYYQQLEANGDQSNSQVADWLNWYSKNKEKLRTKLFKIKQEPM